MKSDLEITKINLNLFLKNIKNFPAIIAALDMLETNYFSQNIFYQVINKSKFQFLDETKPTLNFIDFISEGNLSSTPQFDCDKLFFITKTIASFDSTSDELLKITKEKMNEIINFLNLIKNNFTAIKFPETEQEAIHQEILIVKQELSL